MIFTNNEKQKLLNILQCEHGPAEMMTVMVVVDLHLQDYDINDDQQP